MLSKNINITTFEQGGFYVNSGEEYDNNTEVRSDWIPIKNIKSLTIICPNLTWSFIGRDSTHTFRNISESSGYKDSGATVNLSSYSWISEFRIELHKDEGLSPPQTCEALCTVPWVMYNLNTVSTYNPIINIRQPYPALTWRIQENQNDGFPYMGLFLPVEKMGAFTNAKNLKSVSLPKTVKLIGKFAFRNTVLTSVTIARDCEYYPTSFPDGCIINFYE